MFEIFYRSFLSQNNIFDVKNSQKLLGVTIEHVFFEKQTIECNGHVWPQIALKFAYVVFWIVFSLFLVIWNHVM